MGPLEKIIIESFKELNSYSDLKLCRRAKFGNTLFNKRS